MSSSRTLLAAAAAVVFALPLLAQDQDFSKVEIKTQKLAEGIYMLTGSGGNIGLSAGADGVVVVDDQFAPLTPKIKAAIAAVSNEPVRFLLNTHWHFDHTGGNENFAKEGVVVVAHDNVRKRMSVDQFIEALKIKTPASPAKALPIVTFNDTVTFHLNGDELVAFHVPRAHTDGDTIIWFQKANVVHMGDTFFNGGYPFVDTSSGGTLDGTLAASDRILAMANAETKIIPGHGPVGSKTDLKTYRDVLEGSRAAVEPLVKAGKSLKEVQDAKPTKAFDEKWGTGFIKPAEWVALVYGEVAKKLGKK